MRQRLIVGVVVVAALVAGVVAVARFGSSSVSVRSGGGLPKLPAGMSTATGEALAAKGGDTAASTVAPRALPAYAGPDIQVTGTLPDMPGGTTAVAYQFGDERMSDAEVRKLAASLGVQGTLEDKGDSSAVMGTNGTVIVERTGARSWSMFSSDNSGTATIGCAVPPCAPGADCPATKCATPQKPADLPTKVEAAQAARTLLTKIGDDLDGAAVTIDDQFSSWSVRYDRKVSGAVVAGWTSAVSVGPKGKILGASGSLGTPIKLGDYPLAGSKVGLDRARQGRWVGGFGSPIAMASDVASGTATASAGGPATTIPYLPNENAGAIAPTRAPDSPPAPATTIPGKPLVSEPLPIEPVPTVPIARPVVTVTGIHLGWAFVRAGESASSRIVPVYVLETANAGELPAVPAVVDSLLEDTTPASGSRVTIEPGSVSGSGSGSGSSSSGSAGAGSTGSAGAATEPAPPMTVAP